MSKMFTCSGPGPEPDLVAIQEELSKFGGGSVDLDMDEQTGIAVMTLNNPRTRNSITGTMMVQMLERVKQLEAWTKGKGVILMGAQGSFCSGGDLTFYKKALHYGAEMATYMQHTLTRLHNIPLISVALLQGHALGGGAELSTNCDFRVMSPSAKIGFIQIKMGLTCSWGATTRLVHLLGRQKALTLLCSGKVLTSEESKDNGLVDHVLSHDLAHEQEVSECKNWLISNYCEQQAEMIQAVKSSVVFSDLNRDLDISLTKERELFVKYWGGPAQIAALQAKMKHKQ